MPSGMAIAYQEAPRRSYAMQGFCIMWQEDVAVCFGQTMLNLIYMRRFTQ